MIRTRRTLAAVPFVAAHLLLFFTLDFAVALAALIVAVEHAQISRSGRLSAADHRPEA